MNRLLPSKRKTILLGFVLFTIIARMLPLWSSDDTTRALANYSPLGSLALLGGAYFRGYRAFLVVLTSIWLSDVLLARFVYDGEWIFFYKGFYWTYGAFGLMVLVGCYMTPNRSSGRFLLSVLTIVAIHWIVTDIGVWLTGTMYPITLEGLYTCLIMAIPFELNFLLATTVYGALLFVPFEWMKRQYSWLVVTS